jgi:hypothetical protein
MYLIVAKYDFPVVPVSRVDVRPQEAFGDQVRGRLSGNHEIY